MVRRILGVVLGIAAWFVVVLGISFAIRAADPALNAALLAHATTAAQAERLAISFLGTLAAGFIAALASGERSRAPLIAGVLLLLFWGYYHVTMIWHQFPLWYHLTFFVSLVLLSVAGGRLKRG
ncbi:MAG: hypothetical protein WDM91_09285 [Rhizomicrobium sp.]